MKIQQSVAMEGFIANMKVVSSRTTKCKWLKPSTAVLLNMKVYMIKHLRELFEKVHFYQHGEDYK